MGEIKTAELSVCLCTRSCACASMCACLQCVETKPCLFCFHCDRDRYLRVTTMILYVLSFPCHPKQFIEVISIAKYYELQRSNILQCAIIPENSRSFIPARANNLAAISLSSASCRALA